MNSQHSIQNPTRRRRRRSAGLTLVELIVVIAVIGFFSAIAFPTLKDVLTSASSATAKRNAQSIAMVASVAEVMGSDPLKDAADLGEAVDIVLAGVDSSFSQAHFEGGNLSPEDVNDALEYLRFEDGMLLFSADPAAPGSGTGSTASSSLVTSPIGNF